MGEPFFPVKDPKGTGSSPSVEDPRPLDTMEAQKLLLPQQECTGRCVTATDLGAWEYGDLIAYADPDCDKHGDGR